MNKEIVEFSKEDIFSLSSLAYLEAPTNKELDIKWLENIISSILSRRFKNSLKQSIDYYSNRITFSCPYCGDSEENPNKKRGNIFFDSLGYHCYNCGYHTSAYNLVKFYSEDISAEELFFLKTFKGSNSSLSHFTELLNTNLIKKYAISKSKILDIFGFKLVKGTIAEEYLKNRLQSEFHKFAYDDKSNAVVIFNQDDEENVLGFAKRMLNKGITNRYLSYKISSIYEKIGPTEDSLEYLDRISMVFNIMNVDFNRNLTIFEGPFDAFLYDNALATSGLTKELPLDGENLRYFLDCDTDGLNKSKEYIIEGKSVFLWNKYFKDLKIPNYKHIKDFTELLVYCKKNKIKLNDFNDYFSKSNLDLYFL